MSHPPGLKRGLTAFRERALDLLFPRRCAGCGAEGRYLCVRCLASLTPLRPPWCPHCGHPRLAPGLCADCQSRPRQLRGIRAAFVFAGPLREAVLQFKYQGVSAMAGELAPLLMKHLTAHPIPFDCIAPVPLFSDRARERGYNQAALLAAHLGQSTGLPVYEKALQRVRRTDPQARQGSWQDRFTNVAGAFEADTRLVARRRVLVVDDVCTTGATLEACGTALRAAGAAGAWGLALAREL